jgi:sigma-B regulation protein RsbU (phosphoserine phosphatase)
MMGWYVAAFLLLMWAGFGWIVFTSRRKGKARIDFLSESNTHRVDREHRLFEFFHELGVSSVRAQQESAMHRVIADGAMSVMAMQGAALYLYDEATKVLVPKHYTDKCPPLVPLPERIVEQARTNSGTLASFLRLHGVSSDTGLLGNVFGQRKVEHVQDLRRHPKFGGASNELQQNISVLFCPLIAGKRRLGVLAVATVKPENPFSAEDIEVFEALGEQCAFAIGSRHAHAEATAKKALEAELRNASEIQRVLLPDKAPEMKGFEIACRNLPAQLVSGDYYDFFPVDDEHYGVVIADVSGKGISASLITAMCRSVLRTHARSDLSPASVLAKVNRNLFPDIREDMFITSTYVEVSKDGNDVVLARAGHTNPLLWRKASGEVEEIKAPGLAVGVDKGDVFERVTKDVVLDMQTGDVLLLYTDGVNEATDHKGLEFGEKRLRTSLAEGAPVSAQRVVETIIEDVDTFMAGDPKGDDITIVVIRKR